MSKISVTDGLELIDPHGYATRGAPHDRWSVLREKSPVHYCEPPKYPPFWAITRHADICSISKNPDVFLNSPGIELFPTDVQLERDESGGVGGMRMIIDMDPPDHREFRKVASPWFTSRALKRIDAMIKESARDTVDRLAGESGEGEGECDFATQVAATHPLRIISTILGLPREQEETVSRLTNQLLAVEDPEIGGSGGNQQASLEETGMEFSRLFDRIIQDRKAHPRDDLASLYANAMINGKPIGSMETLGYYLITFTAGHDTTKNALTGGMRALIDHPDQLDELRRNPDSIDLAVEEMLRWASPVAYMMRTAACDTEVSGNKISKGDRLLLFYASANRDEAVFDDPFRFRIDRTPNRHLAFGFGEHFCLGAHLARRSQHALFAELVSRLDHVEMNGKAEWITSSFVVGMKHLPIRYRIAKGR
jgi:cytochrome P450